MSRVASLWFMCGSLCAVFTFVLVVEGSGWTEDEIITEMPMDVELPSQCLLTCTGLTYRQILNRQNILTVRFRDSDSGEFCWDVQKRWSLWDKVFVLLPASESLLNEEMVQIHISSSTHTDPIQPHDSASILPDDCGLRFDVTPHLRQKQRQTVCVRLTRILKNTLRCPPFLAIIRNKHTKSVTRT